MTITPSPRAPSPSDRAAPISTVEVTCGASGQWLIAAEHDGIHGYHWWATRLGVLWAKGWLRTTSQDAAVIQARHIALGHYGAERIAGRV